MIPRILLGKRPAVVARTVMCSSVEWRQVKQHNSLSDLEKLHWEKKSQAEQEEKCQSGIHTDTESCTHCPHTCIRTHTVQWAHAIVQSDGIYFLPLHAIFDSFLDLI